MRVHFTVVGWDHFLSWQSDVDTMRKIIQLIEDIRRSPFTGTGKPEPLKKPLSGCWPRRINKEHRIVYRVSGKDDDQSVTIVYCRSHYGQS
ncbi:MAG: Txe/YoeB family addiction module toxin [Acetobacteraceae bacterium]|nr:Txe/YoeB family addiction module toxin [Acetobacteraceae bacterium]